MVQISGDFDRLRRMIEAMEEMAGGFFGNSFLSFLRQLLAARVSQLIGESFSSRKTPYGLPWKPSKKPGAGDLIETGRLKGSLTIKATREGISVSSSAPYAVVHQFGAKGKHRIPARPFVPNREVWPSTWAKAFEGETLEATHKLWEGV